MKQTRDTARLLLVADSDITTQINFLTGFHFLHFLQSSTNLDFGWLSINLLSHPSLRWSSHSQDGSILRVSPLWASIFLQDWRTWQE